VTVPYPDNLARGHSKLEQVTLADTLTECSRSRNHRADRVRHTETDWRHPQPERRGSWTHWSTAADRPDRPPTRLGPISASCR